MAHQTTRQDGAAAGDLDTLHQLNESFVGSVEHADARWFDEHLAPDFLNSNPDGSLVERAGFLAQISRGSSVRDLKAQDVRVRIMGDFAIIHAETVYTKSNGERGRGRYTDVWSRQQGVWLCVSAHVTRC